MSVREVRLDAGGCTLAGTYAEVAAPVAAALLIPGSGRTDRHSDSRLPGGLKLRGGITRELAHSLAAARVSTLRYDKRGVGASGGDYLSAGMSERAADASSALDWLAAEAPGLPLLVIGHSEGTYYAAQLAAEERAAGIVLLSGSVRRGGELRAWQAEQLAGRLPAASKLILRLLRTDVARAQRKNMDRVVASTEDVVRVQGQRVNARWLREFAAYDPAPALARIAVPVLAITGGHDLQVPPEDVQAVGRLVRGPFEGHVLDGLSHLLRPDPKLLGPRGYRRSVQHPVSPQVPALISDWAGRYCGR